MKTILASLLLLSMPVFAAPDGGVHATPTVTATLPAITVAPSAPTSVIADFAAFGLTGWPALVMLGLVVLGYALRKYAPQAHFCHSPTGTTVLSLLTGLVSAAMPLIQDHGLDVHALTNGLTGWGLSFLALTNPSVPSGQLAPLAQEKADLSGPVPVVAPAPSVTPPDSPKAA